VVRVTILATESSGTCKTFGTLVHQWLFLQFYILHNIHIVLHIHMSTKSLLVGDDCLLLVS
jgi:hypothetical protein